MSRWITMGLLLVIAWGPALWAQPWTDWDLPVEVHGFWEGRAGMRLQNDPHEKDASVLETRLQLEATALPDWGEVVVKADAVADGIQEEAQVDLREANVTFTPLDWVDVKVGRQIQTWGVGDLVFINDLFPKDWQSFFIGRDSEYLKAPSDAVKIRLYSDWGDLDILYSPLFDADRHINGEYLSYWNGSAIVGREQILQTDQPDRWFRQDEWALRLSKRVDSFELALYGYVGYWKSPAGSNASMTKSQFPDLNVYGASVQGPWAGGLIKGEIGYYDSREDRSGTNPLVNNCEWRYLVGYEHELARELTGALQYYVEQMTDYDGYRAGGGRTRDEFRHLLTGRLTKLLMNQNLKLGLFTYVSPSDRDGCLRPNLHYKASDTVSWEIGGNVFWGESDSSFFGQFRDNTNAYAALRASF